MQPKTLREEILAIVRFTPTKLKGKYVGLLPAEIAQIRTNSLMKKFTFRNVIRWKLENTKRNIYKLLSNKNEKAD